MDNMKSLFDFGVFGYIDKPDAEKIIYLDFVQTKTEKPKEESGWDKIMPAFGEGGLGETTMAPRGGEITEISIKPVSADIPKVTEEIPVTGDELDAIRKVVVRKAFDLMVEHADENRELVNDKFPTGIDIVLPVADARNRFRKLLARIFAVSNMIATMGRRGPATFVVVNEEIYKMLFLSDIGEDDILYAPEPQMGGIKFFISPIGNKVIVGRMPKIENSDQGIYIQCKTPETTDYVLNDNNDITAVNATYAVFAVGKTPCISFNIEG